MKQHLESNQTQDDEGSVTRADFATITQRFDGMIDGWVCKKVNQALTP